MSISRVADRVRRGGHSIPEETIRRRYESGLKNFFTLYSPIADSWQLYDNSNAENLKPIANKSNNKINIENDAVWKNLQEKYNG